MTIDVISTILNHVEMQAVVDDSIHAQANLDGLRYCATHCWYLVASFQEEEGTVLATNGSR